MGLTTVEIANKIGHFLNAAAVMQRSNFDRDVVAITFCHIGRDDQGREVGDAWVEVDGDTVFIDPTMTTTNMMDQIVWFCNQNAIPVVIN